MAILTEPQRVASATIGKDRYPIPDKNHARAAIMLINKGGLSEDQKKAVIAKAHQMLSQGKK